MQYLQPSGRFATVGRGARKVVVRPPTLSTVVLLLSTMPAEVAGLVKAWKAEPSMSSPAALPGIVSTIVQAGGARIVPILESFASFHDAPPWALREELATDLELAVPIVMAAMGMMDLPRFYLDAHLHKLDADALGAEAVEGLEESDPLTVLEKLTLRLAWKFGQPPHAVMDWPWESFMAGVRMLALLRDDVALEDLAPQAPEYYEGSSADSALGIVYEKAAPDGG